MGSVVVAGTRRSSDDSWVSSSELADYAYCPRSWWYRRHPPAAGRTAESDRSARAGIRYHDRALVAEWRREQIGWLYVALLAIAVALVVGGFAWILG